MFGTNVTELPQIDYEYITREEDARRIMNELDRHDIIELDTEGTGLNQFTARITLFQIGIPGKAYVFDNRSDTEHSDFNIELFRPILEGKKHLKLIQNASYEMKMIKYNHGFFIDNIYDTMLVEHLLTLGLYRKPALMYKYGALNAIILRRLGLSMSKEPRGTFEDYNQKFQPFQLAYSANDVAVLRLIKDLQSFEIKQHGLEDVCQLEFDFVKPLCIMELNGIGFDFNRQRSILKDAAVEYDLCKRKAMKEINPVIDQSTMFDVSIVNIDSNVQLLKTLRAFGFDINNTQEKTLRLFEGAPVIDALLSYGKSKKFINTYGESLIEKIRDGKLHTTFNQMVSTGRLSSAAPNLQNIPKEQKYRTSFIAKPGKSLITSDMNGAELRILGNLSRDPIFLECYANGIDIHSRTAAEINGVPMDKVTPAMRTAAKTLNFGLVYGLSKYGLASQLSCTERKAASIISAYFNRYKGVKSYLDETAMAAIQKGFTTSISGRKRFYDVPDWEDPDRKGKIGIIERAAKNASVQGANADTIKKSMIYLVEELENYDAELILSVHDEVVVECRDDLIPEVREIVSKSLIDGFGHYFSTIPMEADALVGPCWLKHECEACKGLEMVFNDKRELVCGSCGSPQ